MREQPEARDRAYTMLMMAEAGLHAFDHDDGRKTYDVFEAAGMDDDTKGTVLLHLHENPNVGQLLLDRCGVSPRWLTGNQAWAMSRRMRQHGFPSAFNRDIVEHVKNNPDTCYIIGPEHRIPRPGPEEMETCAAALRQVGLDDRRIENALATLGVPPGGHNPPKKRRR